MSAGGAGSRGNDISEKVEEERQSTLLCHSAQLWIMMRYNLWNVSVYSCRGGYGARWLGRHSYVFLPCLRDLGMAGY